MEVVVGVDVAALGEGACPRVAQDEVLEEVPRRAQVHRLQVLANGRDRHAASQGRLVDDDGIVRADDLGVVVGEPDHHVAEGAGERPEHGLHVPGGQLVEREPLAGNPPGGEAVGDAPEVLRGVEVGGASRPRVDGVGGDDVELLAGGGQEVAPVVEDDAELRVVEDVAVPLREGARHAQHAGLDLGEDDPLDLRVERGGAQGHAAAGPEHEDLLRVGVQQHRHVPEGALALDVHRVVRGLGAAVDHEGLEAAAGAGHGHGLVHPLVEVEDLHVAEPLADGCRASRCGRRRPSRWRSTSGPRPGPRWGRATRTCDDQGGGHPRGHHQPAPTQGGERDGHAGPDVHGDQHVQRALHAEQVDEREAAHHRAQDGADGVHGEDAADGAGDASAPAPPRRARPRGRPRP